MSRPPFGEAIATKRNSFVNRIFLVTFGDIGGNADLSSVDLHPHGDALALGDCRHPFQIGLFHEGWGRHIAS
jgi:hypothetical protein